MKVKLLRDVPVEEKHGMAEGRVFEVSRMAERTERARVFVVGDAGEEVGLLWAEFEAVQE